DVVDVGAGFDIFEDCSDGHTGPRSTHAPLTLPGMLSTAGHCDQSRFAIAGPPFSRIAPNFSGNTGGKDPERTSTASVPRPALSTGTRANPRVQRSSPQPRVAIIPFKGGVDVPLHSVSDAHSVSASHELRQPAARRAGK